MRVISVSSASAATSASNPPTIARDCAPEPVYDSCTSTSCPVLSFQYFTNSGIIFLYASRGAEYAPSINSTFPGVVVCVGTTPVTTLEGAFDVCGPHASVPAANNTTDKNFNRSFNCPTLSTSFSPLILLFKWELYYSSISGLFPHVNPQCPAGN